MVWGYAEPLFLLLSVATFLMLRTNRFAAAGLFAALAALTRPLGLVIALPAAIEAGRGFRTAGLRSRVERVVAVVAAPLATLGFLLWVRGRTGDLLDPYRIQSEAIRRGRTVDPFTGVANALSEFFDHDRIGPLLHVGWAVIAIALVVVTFRRLPVSYGLFAAATLVVALSSRNLDSFERYTFNAFPLVIAAALVVRNRRLETLVFTAMGAAMCLYGFVAAWPSTCPDFSSLAAAQGTCAADARSWRATRWAASLRSPPDSSPRSAGWRVTRLASLAVVVAECWARRVWLGSLRSPSRKFVRERGQRSLRDEAVDEAAELFAHLDVEAFGAVEGVARLHRVVACHVERALDRTVAGGDAANFGQLLLVDRLPEQVAELR